MNNDNTLRIEESIDYLNKSREKLGLKKVTNTEIAALVFDNVPPHTAGQYFSRLKKGYKMSAVEPRHIVRIASLCGVSTDFLLGVTEDPTPAPEIEVEKD